MTAVRPPRWAEAVATVAGSGRSPVAPGTVGTLVALPAALGLATLPLWVQLTAIAVVIVVGTYAAHVVAAVSDDEDPQFIVVDELAGIFLTFLAVPITWATAIFGFAIFRAFDIAKPFPVGWLDSNVPGGAGIMADDLAAGALACAALHIGVWLW